VLDAGLPPALGSLLRFGFLYHGYSGTIARRTLPSLQRSRLLTPTYQLKARAVSCPLRRFIFIPCLTWRLPATAFLHGDTVLRANRTTPYTTCSRTHTVTDSTAPLRNHPCCTALFAGEQHSRRPSHLTPPSTKTTPGLRTLATTTSLHCAWRNLTRSDTCGGATC